MKIAFASAVVLAASSWLSAPAGAAPATLPVGAVMVASDLPSAVAKKKAVTKKQAKAKKARAGAGKK